MKAKNKTVTFGGFTLFLLLIIFISQSPASSAWFWQSKDSKKPDTIFGVTKSSQGEVTIELTPVDYDKGKLSINIGVNTHSIDDLNTYDLTKITVLKTGTFNINPVSAPKISGHHGSGKLVFEIEKLPNEFTISINGLNNESNRKFIWP